MTERLKRLLIGGTITGSATGLFVGIATSGDSLSGLGAIFAFFVAPGLTAALVKTVCQRAQLLSTKWLFARLLFVTYLTTFPLFGLLAGGASVPVSVIAGAFFGTFWAMLFILPSRER